MNQSTIIPPERIIRSIRNRFSPIRNLTPEVLARQLENAQVGYIREAALTWDAIENRDPLLKNVAMKRKKSVARNGWEVLVADGADATEAQAHKEALEIFFNNLTCTSVVEQNQRGGMALLLRQMMDAVGKRYAVHEIVWKPQNASGADILKTSAAAAAAGKELSLDSILTAEFRFVPLWFFESRIGKLRFLPSESAAEGVEMRDTDWMVTVGDGIMEACSVAYMYKHLSLKDWVAFSEKFGMPGVLGKTDATVDSEEWNALIAAVQAFGQDWAAVCNRSAEIDTVEVKNAGNLPYQPLVEQMDRSMASLWRGADLATISQGNSVGASLQADEGSLLLEDDLVLCEESINEQVTKPAIRYLFGTNRSLAYLKLKRPVAKNIEQDIKVDDFLLRSGAPVSVQSALQRYERPMPDAADPLLKAPAIQSPFGSPGGGGAGPGGNPADLTNDGAVNVNRLAAAFAEDLQPLHTRLERILSIDDPDLMRSKLEAFLREIPNLLKDINADPASARVLEDAMQKGILAGAAARAGAPAGGTP